MLRAECTASSLLVVCTRNGTRVEVLLIRSVVFRKLSLAFGNNEIHVVVDVESDNHFIEWLGQAARLQIKAEKRLEYY